MRGSTDTIVALATPVGRSALQVVRISGPDTVAVLTALCRKLPPPRQAGLRTFRDEADVVLDRGLVLWFRGPQSYTGEDCGELHLHGGVAVQAAIVRAVRHHGVRLAQPGEFTRRAVLNGRLDLVEAEAVADLINAETELQRSQALRQMQGELGNIIATWTARLRRLLATHEATIDFPDETEDNTPDPREVQSLISEMELMLTRGAASRVRNGVVVAITGAPNAGKSSLMNSLTQREMAIVSPQPGTTRDVLEARLILDGRLVTLLDTAGLRPTHDAIESEGVRRARQRASDADIVLHLVEANGGSSLPPPSSSGRILRVTTKCDLGPPFPGNCGVSTIGDPGTAPLLDHLLHHIRDLTDTSELAGFTRQRQQAAVENTVAALRSSLIAVEPELVAEEIRRALWELGRVTGKTDIEAVLDDIFSEFCIGK